MTQYEIPDVLWFDGPHDVSVDTVSGEVTFIVRTREHDAAAVMERSKFISAVEKALNVKIVEKEEA